MMLQGNFYARQSLIGATSCKYYSIVGAFDEVIPLRPFINSVRARLRACEDEFDWLSSYHSRCFYEKYSPSPDKLELGYLKSALLLQVHDSLLIFTFHFDLGPCSGLQSHFYITFFSKRHR